MATLKISELSIGDWVNHENKEYRLYAIEECGLLRGKWESDEDLAHIAKNIDYFDPIPITAEMLEKNGFAPDEYSNKIWSFIAERELIQYFFVNHKLCIRNHRNAVDVDVLHIHELQHAMRLAGVDKEINL